MRWRAFSYMYKPSTQKKPCAYLWKKNLLYFDKISICTGIKAPEFCMPDACAYVHVYARRFFTLLTKDPHFLGEAQSRNRKFLRYAMYLLKSLSCTVLTFCHCHALADKHGAFQLDIHFTNTVVGFCEYIEYSHVS